MKRDPDQANTVSEPYAELVRAGCCDTWPKPCTYHEGFADGIEAVLRARTRLADEGDCHCDYCLTEAANMGSSND